jgi:hypothetical protein
MTTFNIDTDSIINKVVRDARDSIENKAKEATSNIIRSHFNSGQYRGPEGLGHQIVRQKVEDFILSEEFNRVVDTAIEKHMEEEAGRAVKVLLNSRTRKHLFEATK